MNRHVNIAVTGAGIVVLALAGCATESGGGDASPIVVGSVNALSGPATFPESSAAAAAVFDEVNAAGGIGGRPIEYTVLDDKGDPATASAAAREVVDGGSVALVGSASTVDCAVNGSYYDQSGIASIQGTGVEPECFASPNIAPVNTGPFFGTTLALLYGSETLGLERICGLFEITGSSKQAYEHAVERWTDATGKSLHYVDDSVPFGASDYTPYIVTAKSQGCDGVFTMTVAPDVLGQMKAAAQQGWTDVTWLGLTSIYGEEFVQAIGADIGEGIYAAAEFAPYTDPESEVNAEWRELMMAHDVPLTSFSQGGYLAARNFVEVLEGIDGEITRESVLTALRDMEPIENPMVGTPYVFGPGDAHTPNQAGWAVQLDEGASAWELAADGWITLP